MLNFKPVLFIIGLLLSVLALSFFVPLFIDVYYKNEDWRVFLLSSIITGFIGGALIIMNRNTPIHFKTREAFIMTGLSWILIPAAGALPFYIGDFGLNLADAYFEAVSGITTTGGTVMTGLDTAPPGILIWRAILQWLGGVGVLIMALSVMPFLNIGGMQLFKLEALENEKALPKSTKLAANIVLIYIMITILCFLAYRFTSMDNFDALAHALTTVSTGGYSTKDASIGYFADTPALYVASFFMVLGSLPFILYLKIIRFGNIRLLYKDTQVRWFISIVALCVGLTWFFLILEFDMPFEYAFKHALVNVISLITGTGYSSTNYNLWGHFFLIFSFFFMMIGGCAGSTTCGIKIFRFQVLASVCHAQINKAVFPSGVFVPKYNKKALPESVVTSVLSFLFLYAASFMVLALTLGLLGLDTITALSGAATAISNVGPGLGDIIGPAGNFSPLPDAAKWVLSIGMIVGRLELFTLLILLSPTFWRS